MIQHICIALAAIATLCSAAIAEPNLHAAAAGAAAQDGIPGIAVAVVNSDVTIAASHAGVRASDDENATPVSANDRWHLGSNTKVMTALVAARLVDRGLISWESTIGQVLQRQVEQAGPPADAHSSVTLRQLLNHTSGIADNSTFNRSAWLSFFALDPSVDADREAATLAVLASEPVGVAGETYLYSNLGYIVAGAMIEEAGGASWQALIQRELAEPLGLTTLGFGPPGILSAEIPDQPRGHAQTRSGLRSINSKSVVIDNPLVIGPAGTVHLGFSDIQEFIRVLLEGTRAGFDATVTPPSDTDGNVWVTRASWQAVMGERAVAEGRSGYGLGIGYARDSEAEPEDGFFTHSGSNTMWFTTFVLYPWLDRAGVVCTNSATVEAERACWGLSSHLPRLYAEDESEGD